GHVEPGHGALFVRETRGFAAVEYYSDGSAWLSFYHPADDGSAEVLYTSRIRQGTQDLVAARSSAQADVDEPATLFEALNLQGGKRDTIDTGTDEEIAERDSVYQGGQADSMPQ